MPKKHQEQDWYQLILQENKKKLRSPLLSLPRELRGFSNNRYGGHQSQHMRAFRGTKFGPASVGRSLNAEEKAMVIAKMKEEGSI